MKMTIRVELTAHTQDHEMRIHVPEQGERQITHDGGITVERLVDYQHHSDHIDVFSIAAMREGLYQRISIERIQINGIDLPDWRQFCQFHAQGNRYRADGITHPCTELSFRGRFQINTRHRRAQWLWSEDYHSDHRSDFVSDNMRWDCDDTHHCHGSDLCQSSTGPHTNRWLNLPHDPRYQAGDHYDYGTFGCSITQGMALPRGREWPALLAGEHRVINLASPGLGIDGVFLNVQHALRKFDMDRVVVVLPSYTRRLLRFQVDHAHHRVPVCLSAEPGHQRFASTWMPGPELTRRTEQLQHHMGRHPDRHRRLGQRITARMLTMLENTGRPYWITSWNEDVYRDLERDTPSQHLLPRFPMDRAARDHRHTSSGAHAQWLASVRSHIL